MIGQNIAIMNQSPVCIMKSKSTQKQEVDAPDIRCFCKKHAAEYINSGSYILKRLNYGRAILDKCDRLGFGFILIKKKDDCR